MPVTYLYLIYHETQSEKYVGFRKRRQRPFFNVRAFQGTIKMGDNWDMVLMFVRSTTSHGTWMRWVVRTTSLAVGVAVFCEKVLLTTDEFSCSFWHDEICYSSSPTDDKSWWQDRQIHYHVTPSYQLPRPSPPLTHPSRHGRVQICTSIHAMVVCTN